MEAPLISVVIASLNGEQYVPNCIQSLLNCRGGRIEIILVDNGSGAPFQEMARGLPPSIVQIRLERNAGFAAGCNAGLRQARGDILLLLNDDTIVERESLQACVARFAAEPNIGIVGARIVDLDNPERLQHAGAGLTPEGFTYHIGSDEQDEGQYNQVRNVEYVTGAALALRRAVYEQYGGLEETYWPLYYEEVEYCVRARAGGWDVVYEPGMLIRHLAMRTSTPRSQRYYYRYHRNRLRFVLRNWTHATVLHWSLRELRWLLLSAQHLRQKPACLLAWLHTMLHLPQIIRGRRLRQ